MKITIFRTPRRAARIAWTPFAIVALGVLTAVAADGPSGANAGKVSSGEEAGDKEAGDKKNAGRSAKAELVPDSKQVGGESDSVVQVANLVYAGSRSSQCFSDHFLVRAEKDSAISTSRRFHAVKLSSDEIYDFPMLIMTGEGDFTLPDSERDSLQRYIERGGFLLASAGCSSDAWDRSFRREMAAIFPDHRLKPIDMKHAVFNTVYTIERLEVKHGGSRPLEGVHVNGRLGVLYSRDGLNDTAHTQGCCCCGGNEIRNAEQINVNILAYALTN